MVVVCCCFCLVTKLCPFLCDPTNYTLQGAFVHEIFQARILEWVAISSFRGSFDVGLYPCFYIGRQIFFFLNPVSHLGSPHGGKDTLLEEQLKGLMNARGEKRSRS